MNGKALFWRKETLQVFAGSILATFSAWLLSPKDFMGGDSRHYLKMALGETVTAPFAYRVLAPGIVRFVPLDPKIGFYLVTFLSTLGVLWVSYLLFRSLGVSQSSALFTMGLVGLSYPIAYYLNAWGLVDPLANFFFVLGLLFLLRRKIWAASAVVTVGVFAKETVALLLPLMIWVAINQKKKESFRDAFLVCLGPLAGLLIPRLVITPVAGIYDIHTFTDLLTLWRLIWSYNFDKYGFFLRIARIIMQSYGFYWAMAAFGLLFRREARLESLYLLTAGAALCLIATGWTRMLGTVFPGIFIPCALFLDRIQALRNSGWIKAGLGILAVMQCYLALVHYESLGEQAQTALTLGTGVIFLLGTLSVVSTAILTRRTGWQSAPPLDHPGG